MRVVSFKVASLDLAYDEGGMIIRKIDMKYIFVYPMKARIEKTNHC